jgi:prepilin-type processing-associated H-X9-DG protein
MPSANAVDASGGAARPTVRRQLATVNSGAEKMLVWDGGRVTTLNNNARSTSMHLDVSQWATGHKFCDPADDGSSLDQVISIGGFPVNENALHNVDSANPDECGMRFRHNSNRQLAALFCDGHAEQRQLNSVMRKDVCVNRK